MTHAKSSNIVHCGRGWIRHMHQFMKANLSSSKNIIVYHILKKSSKRDPFGNVILQTSYLLY